MAPAVLQHTALQVPGLTAPALISLKAVNKKKRETSMILKYLTLSCLNSLIILIANDLVLGGKNPHQ